MMIYYEKLRILRGRCVKTGKKGKFSSYIGGKISFLRKGLWQKYHILDKYTPLSKIVAVKGSTVGKRKSLEPIERM